MSTFSDLNLNVTNLQEKQIDQLVEHAIKLGYDNLALAVDYEFPSSTSQNKPEQQGNKKNKKDGSNKPVINIPLAKSYKLPQALQDRLNSCSRKIKIYSRITVKIKPGDINTCLHHLKSKPVLSYDLIALEPLDNQVLLYLCTNNFNADIISINSGISCGLTDKHLMRPLKNALTSFSMRFELNYSPSITSSTERRDFIMAGRCLTFNTNSNGLIISSGCSQKIGLRGPYEILNIVKLFDIKDLSAHQIVRRTPHDIITNSFCRKHTSAGMVYFNDISDLKRLEKALLSLKEKRDEAALKSSTTSQSEDKQHDQNISNKRLKKE